MKKAEKQEIIQDARRFGVLYPSLRTFYTVVSGGSRNLKRGGKQWLSLLNYNARSVLLGGSGGMPPPEKF